MSIEGLWVVQFRSNSMDMGTGVAVFVDGKIHGGDASYYYTGEYSENENKMNAELLVEHYGEGSDIFGLSKIGVKNFILRLSGEPRSTEVDQSFMAHGTVNGYPGMNIEISLTKKAEL